MSVSRVPAARPLAAAETPTPSYVWVVEAPSLPPVQVSARNWIVALGIGLQRLGVEPDINRLACELLQNGSAIAHDTENGVRYVVRPATVAELEAPPPR